MERMRGMRPMLWTRLLNLRMRAVVLSPSFLVTSTLLFMGTHPTIPHSQESIVRGPQSGRRAADRRIPFWLRGLLLEERRKFTDRHDVLHTIRDVPDDHGIFECVFVPHDYAIADIKPGRL